VCNFDKTEIFMPRAADSTHSLPVICVGMKISGQAHHNTNKSPAKAITAEPRTRLAPPAAGTSRSLGDSGLRIAEICLLGQRAAPVARVQRNGRLRRFSAHAWGG